MEGNLNKLCNPPQFLNSVFKSVKQTTAHYRFLCILKDDYNTEFLQCLGNPLLLQLDFSMVGQILTKKNNAQNEFIMAWISWYRITHGK